MFYFIRTHVLAARGQNINWWQVFTSPLRPIRACDGTIMTMTTTKKAKNPNRNLNRSAKIVASTFFLPSGQRHSRQLAAGREKSPPNCCSENGELRPRRRMPRGLRRKKERRRVRIKWNAQVESTYFHIFLRQRRGEEGLPGGQGPQLLDLPAPGQDPLGADAALAAVRRGARARRAPFRRHPPE